MLFCVAIVAALKHGNPQLREDDDLPDFESVYAQELHQQFQSIRAVEHRQVKVQSIQYFNCVSV